MLVYNVAAVVVLAFAGIGFGLYGAALWAGGGPPRGDDRLVHDVAAARCSLPVTKDSSLAKQSTQEEDRRATKPQPKATGQWRMDPPSLIVANDITRHPRASADRLLTEADKRTPFTFPDIYN